MKRLTLAVAVALITADLCAAGAERAWQTGTWRDYQVVRPKVVFGINRSPGGGSRTPPIVEVRTYVIETDDVRLELKENTTSDASRIEVSVGAPVTFALEKKTVYIRMRDGVERKLNVTRNSPRARPRAAGILVFSLVHA